MLNKKLIKKYFIEFKAFLKDKRLLVKYKETNAWVIMNDDTWSLLDESIIEGIVIDDELVEVRKELICPRGTLQVKYSSHDRWYNKSHHKVNNISTRGSAQYRVVLNKSELVYYNNKLFTIDKIIILDNIHYIYDKNEELISYDEVMTITDNTIYLLRDNMQFIEHTKNGVFVNNNGIKVDLNNPLRLSIADARESTLFINNRVYNYDQVSNEEEHF